MIDRLSYSADDAGEPESGRSVRGSGRSTCALVSVVAYGQVGAIQRECN